MLLSNRYSPFQSFDGGGVSIDTKDDTIDGGLACCSFLCCVSRSSCIRLLNDAIDDDGNDADGTAYDTVDGAVDDDVELSGDDDDDDDDNNNFRCP